MVKANDVVTVNGVECVVRSTDGRTWAHVRQPNGMSRPCRVTADGQVVPK
jgi:hypothetical protein